MISVKEPVVDFAIRQPTARAPTPKAEPILPKQKKRQRDKGLPKQSKQRSNPTSPESAGQVRKSFDQHRATPPLEDLINEENFKSIDIPPSSILFPQVINGSLLTSAHITTPDPVTSTQLAPHKLLTVPLIDRGINPVTFLSPDRPNPRSLKGWSERLQHKELDEFASNFIKEMEKAME